MSVCIRNMILTTDSDNRNSRIKAANIRTRREFYPTRPDPTRDNDDPTRGSGRVYPQVRVDPQSSTILTIIVRCVNDAKVEQVRRAIVLLLLWQLP